MSETSWTPRARMLAAYEGRYADRPPVAPEFWYYIPARVLGMTMMDLQMQVPHWQALQQTFRHYGCDGWGVVGPDVPTGLGGTRIEKVTRLSEDRMETLATWRAQGHEIQSRTILDRHEPAWLVERFVKDFQRDWPAYAQMALVPPEELDWHPVQAALDAVGDNYLLEVYLGEPFVDFAGWQREGALQQVILDLHDHEAALLQLQARYIDHMVRKVRAAFTHTTARSVFVGSAWSSLSLLSPGVWRKWDKPVLEAVVQAAHECGGLVHHHFHGRCLRVLDELGSLGLDCICPFERPPGGDITDLAPVRRALADRTTFNGNVHTVETLIRGTPEDVRREVQDILQAFHGTPRVIVGTGDQVGVETPDENIFAMIEAVRQGTYASIEEETGPCQE